MRVVLQAKSGRRAGHRVWIGANQRLHVGGTEWADFVVPGDEQIADVQFVIESDFRKCRIRNLYRSNALLVNGMRIDERTLVDGDIVTAGQTQFLVNIREEDELERKFTLPGRRSDHQRGLYYTAETCESGLIRYRDTKQRVQPRKIARMLADQHSFYLLVNFKRCGLEPPDSLEGACDLLDRDDVSDYIRRRNSLHVLSSFDLVDRFDLMERFWNRDAVIGLFSEAEIAPLLDRLGRGLAWFARPGLLESQLLNGSRDLIQQLLAGITAVLFESRAVGGWTVYTKPELDPSWFRVGFPTPPHDLRVSG